MKVGSEYELSDDEGPDEGEDPATADDPAQPSSSTMFDAAGNFVGGVVEEVVQQREAPPPPEIDDDGFETVQKGRRRRWRFEFFKHNTNVVDK